METKFCSKCKIEQPIENFRWRNKAQGTKHSQCKSCESAKEKLRYKEDIARKLAIIDRDYQYKNRNIEIVDLFKQQGCQKCGESKLYLLDCHHKDPNQKTETIARMIKSSSEYALQEELKKCICLCANCHREFHYLERLNNISIQQYLEG